MTSPIGKALAFAALLGASSLSAGCGAVIARTRVVGAESAVAAAARAGAEKKAPYEYTSALLYLEKAREEENCGRFGPAIEFGGVSSRHAEQARLKSSNADPRPESD